MSTKPKPKEEPVQTVEVIQNGRAFDVPIKKRKNHLSNNERVAIARAIKMNVSIVDYYKMFKRDEKPRAFVKKVYESRLKVGAF